MYLKENNMRTTLVNKTTLRMEPDNKLEANILHKVWKEGILGTRGESKDDRLTAIEIEVQGEA